MTTMPSLTGKKIVKALRKAEFEVVRVKGSHHFTSCVTLIVGLQ